MSPVQLAGVVGLAMIAAAVGLALRGDVPAVVGTAAAAVPVPTVTPMSTLTVTPIEEPSEAPVAVPAVTPVETRSDPEVSTAIGRAPELQPQTERREHAQNKTKRMRKRIAAAHRAARDASETERDRPERARTAAIERRAKVDVSKCVGSALGCLKVGNPVIAVAKANAHRKRPRR
jgi:hypothetical protein